MKKYTPFIISFFKAVMAFKRLARHVLRWKSFKNASEDQSFRPKFGQRSALSVHIKKTDEALMSVRNGGPLFSMHSDDIIHHRRIKELDKINKIKQKNLVLQQIRNRRRFATNKTAILGNRHALAYDMQPEIGVGVKFSKKSLKVKLDTLHETNNRELFKDHLKKDRTTEPVDLSLLMVKNAVRAHAAEDREKNAEQDYQALTHQKGTHVYFGSTLALQVN